MPKHTSIAVTWVASTTVFLFWFIAIMVDCDSPFSAACDSSIWRSWLDFWRLKWIFNYKELIAGVMAATAGGFVLLATRMQVAATNKAASATRVDVAKATLSRAASHFNKLAYKVRWKSTDNSQESLNHLHNEITNIALINTKIVSHLYTIHHSIEITIAMINNNIGKKINEDFTNRINKTHLHAMACRSICLKLAEDIDSEGKSVIVPFPSKIIPAIIKKNNLKVDDLAGLKGFFIFDPDESND
ncbi:hypothetical protein [Bosea sp. LC85]|uniref:hypothetical protein n=1 Tax=Bosea sp. LC85 TaxID=1502851 RepID=UPI00126A20FF|nr:hypothetical protein [Bosea sp. LC85]